METGGRVKEMKQSLTKLMALFFVLVLSTANNVGVMFWGYGVEPKNFWAIIGMGIFANYILYRVIDVITKEEK